MAKLEIDAKQFRRAVRRLSLKLPAELQKGLNAGARLIRDEVRKDWRGRVMQRRTGTTAKSFQAKRGRPRGNILSATIGSKWFVARLHEFGYTLRPFRKRKALASKRIQTIIRGRWVTLSQATRVPPKFILQRQMLKQERSAFRKIGDALRAVVRRAGLA